MFTDNKMEVLHLRKQVGKLSRLARAEAELNAHLTSGCEWCRNSIYRVDAPACSVAVELTRNCREAAKRGRR